MTGRSKSKGVYFRDGIAYIRFQGVLKYFADKRARDITPDVVDAILDYLTGERKLSASGVNHTGRS